MVDARLDDIPGTSTRGRAIKAIIADKANDSDAFVCFVQEVESEVVIPPRNRMELREISRNLYKNRNKIERFFGQIKYYRCSSRLFLSPTGS